jgi:hypothetical protein
MHCDFCGLEFDPACTESGCDGCPLAKGCSRIRCPRCGYEMLPEAKLIGWLRKKFARTGQPNTNANNATKEISC